MDEFGKLVHTIKSRYIGFLFDCRSRSQIDSVNARQSEIFTEHGGGTRAPFSKSGWKSSLTEDSLPVDGLI